MELDLENLLELLHGYGVTAVRIGDYEIELSTAEPDDFDDLDEEFKIEIEDLEVN